MRVLNLCLPDFKNLQNFAIDFSHESSVAVLVGRNGAGKSNVLEALYTYFQRFGLGETG